MTQLIEHLFDDRHELAAALAEAVARRLDEGVSERGRATLAVSGGSTPRRFFEALSRLELAWDKVTITLVDERFVPETSPRSNQRLVAETLLQNNAARARFVPLYNAASTAEEAAEHASAVIAALPRPLDVAILGMGMDGHTASFFPAADRLDEVLSPARDKPVFPITAPGADEPRLTLGFATLADARFLVLHMEGEEKGAVLDRALSDGPETEMPVRALLRRAHTPIDLYWAK